MANKAVFGSATVGRQVPQTDTVNAAGGAAYSFGPEHQLAQLASTGTFNTTFYTSGGSQLDALRAAADQCSPTFIAQCALYAREQAFMKDMPAALAVVLSKADPRLLDQVFDRLIDNGKQLRNFVQMIRSGAFGRKSLGSGPKRLIKRWFASKSDATIFRASVGTNPSLADVIKLARPKPTTPSRSALYAYILGKPHNFEELPAIVQQYERFKKGDRSVGIPNVDFRMLTSLPLTDEDWQTIAKNGGWHQTRMNLNTYGRHGVLQDEGSVERICQILTNSETIRRAKVFPYQLLAAYLNTGSPRDRRPWYYGGEATHEDVSAVPTRVRLALQDALELATENVPTIDGKVAVIVDVSGSMNCPVTGYRKGSTTKVTCVDVAALVAATVLRKNPNSMIVPVDTSVHSTSAINPRDSIMTNAETLAKFGGGGTRLGLALQHINNGRFNPDVIIMVSDNESWFRPDGHSGSGYYRSGGTETAGEWAALRAKNPKAKMVCIDITANTTTQVVDGHGVMNIGGFSDDVWATIQSFLSDEGPEAWVGWIRQIDLGVSP